jgi:general secretion pathway protein F
MPLYHYRALRQSGGQVEGQLAALDEREAAARLQAIGNFPIEIAPAAATIRRRRGRRLSPRALVLFTRQLAALVGAGIAIERALALLARGGDGAALAEALLAAVNRGDSLSVACAAESGLARHYAMVIAAGEAKGDVGGALDRLADIFERNRAISQSLANALVYPASVLVVACLSIAFLLGFVVPRFQNLMTSFRHAPPFSMRALMLASHGFQNFALPIALAGASAVGFVVVRRRDPAFRERFDRRLLRLPLLGPLLAKVEVERLTFLLGNLVAGGVAIPPAVAATREAIGNAALRGGLAAAERGIERGDGVAATLAATGLLPETAIELIRVGEETGDLAAMLLKASDILRRDFEATTAQLIGLIAPVSILLLGLLIGAVALALFGTVMDVYDIAS